MKLFFLATAWFIAGCLSCAAQIGGLALAYDLNVGDHHHFRLVTDHHVVGNRAVRIVSNLYLDVLNEDETGNYLCRVTFRSDTNKYTSDTIVYRPHGQFMFSGFRLYSEAGGYDAVIDALGRIIIGQSVAPSDYAQGTMTAFSRTTDATATEAPLVPYTVVFSIPRSPTSAHLERGMEYRDTVLIRSAVQPISRSYGAAPKPQAATRTNVDTMIRTMTLDSTKTIGSKTIGYFTSLSRKSTVLGAYYTIITQTEREMSTGLVESIVERSYYEGKNGPRLQYATTCKRISASRFNPMNPLEPPGVGKDGE